VPTKRRKIAPARINEPVPDWARRLIETGEVPAQETDAGDAYFDWLFLGAAIPGLPPADSPEGHRLWFRAAPTG
jgi:hypothetical protein